MMDTLTKRWCVWSVSSSNHLMRVEFIGNLEECVRFVDPKCHGCYAIIPE